MIALSSISQKGPTDDLHYKIKRQILDWRASNTDHYNKNRRIFVMLPHNYVGAALKKSYLNFKYRIEHFLKLLYVQKYGDHQNKLHVVRYGKNNSILKEDMVVLINPFSLLSEYAKMNTIERMYKGFGNKFLVNNVIFYHIPTRLYHKNSFCLFKEANYGFEKPFYNFENSKNNLPPEFRTLCFVSSIHNWDVSRISTGLPMGRKLDAVRDKFINRNSDIAPLIDLDHLTRPRQVRKKRKSMYDVDPYAIINATFSEDFFTEICDMMKQTTFYRFWSEYKTRGLK